MLNALPLSLCSINVCLLALAKQLLFVYKVPIFSCDWIHAIEIALESSIPAMNSWWLESKSIDTFNQMIMILCLQRIFYWSIFFVCWLMLGVSIELQMYCIIQYNVCACVCVLAGKCSFTRCSNIVNRIKIQEMKHDCPVYAS